MGKPKAQTPRRFGGEFTLGGEQAEADPLLERAFFESGQVRAAVSKADPRCFLIGRTGSGKSAALQHLEEVHPNHVIRINPEDLSLPYISDLGAIRVLSEMDVHLDPFFIALWKHVFLIEIIRHRYDVESPEAKENFLRNLRDRIKRDRSKSAALDYLEEFEGKFWAETDERVREITNRFEQQINRASEARVGTKGPLVSAGASHANEVARSNEERLQSVERFQRIVNETQLPRLNKMIAVLDEEILDSEQNFTYIVIDDLDRDWADERVANDLIRCLFRAVVDLKRVQNLKILVALRTNIFERLDFGSRTGGQEEKFRSLSMRMRWTPKELESVLSARVRTASGDYGAPMTSITELLPQTNKTRGNALSFILDRTLMRPRDAIAFVNECLVLGSGKNRLTWDVIRDAERAYSSKRLLALRDEWKPTFPGIDRAFHCFAKADSVMSRSDIERRLDEVALLLSDPNFDGTMWLTEMSTPIWNAQTGDLFSDSYQPLFSLLFSVGLLGVAVDRRPIVFTYDDPEFAERASNLDNAIGFSIHPAFHAALDIRTAPDRA